MGETSDITKPAVDALNKLPGVFAMRVNSGKIQTIHGSWVQLAPSGFPDILAIVDGRAVGIETKKRGGKVRDTQVTMARRLERVGVPVYVCRGVGECLKAVQLHLEGGAGDR